MIAGVIAQLRASPFLSDLDQSDRSIVRIIVTVVVGLVVSFIVAGIFLGIAFAAMILPEIMAQAGPPGAPPDPEAIEGVVNGLMDDPSIALIIVLLLGNVLLFGGFSLIAALFRRKSLRTYLSAAPKFRWSLVLAGAALFCLILGPVVAFAAWQDPDLPIWPILTFAETWPTRALMGVLVVIAILFGAMVEEILFRGWLLKQVAAFTRNPWFLLALNGIIFSAVHVPQDLDLNAFIGRAVMGAGFGYMVLRTGGVELATGVHAANNAIILLFIEELQLRPSAEPPGFDPSTILASLVTAVGYVAITEIAIKLWPKKALVEAPNRDAEVFA